MDSQAIHLTLQQSGLTWAAAAEAIGCSPSTLMNIAARRTTSRKLARQLCLLLGRNVAEVFPDIPRYAEPSRAEMHQAMVRAARERLAAAGAPSRNVKSA